MQASFEHLGPCIDPSIAPLALHVCLVHNAMVTCMPASIEQGPLQVCLDDYLHASLVAASTGQYLPWKVFLVHSKEWQVIHTSDACGPFKRAYTLVQNEGYTYC